MMNRPEISLVIPAYNEEDTMEKVINRVSHVVGQMGLEYELIVVDDGSVDHTRRKAVDCARVNSNVSVVSHRKNMGKGYTIKTGFSHARGDAVVFIDSDLEIDPRQIGRCVRALEHGDIVVASKWHPQSRVEVPLMRKFLSYGFNALVKLLTRITLRDTQTGLKAVRRKALERVFSKLTVERFAFDVELLAVANLYGLKTVELPVNIRMRHLFNLREVWRMFLDLLGIAYRLRVLKWYQRR